MGVDKQTPAFPRLSADQSVTLLSELAGLRIDELERRATSDLSGATFYPLANSRLTEDQLTAVRTLIDSVAMEHGYPVRQSPAERRKFDQHLSLRLHHDVSMMRADAADSDVWSFLSLVACPNVAFWRYPPNAQADDAESTDPSSGELDRLLGGVRHVFGRLWWRAEILGGDVSARLLEDEAVGLLERPTIGGYPLLARAVAARQLALTDELGGEKRQDIFRDALKRLRRSMGQLSVYVLTTRDLNDLVNGLFEDAVLAIAGRELSLTGQGRPAMEAFEANCEGLWPLVLRLLGEPTWDEIISMRGRAQDYLQDDPTMAFMATRIAGDLGQLIERWNEWSSDERSIITASMRYFLMEDDANADDGEGGLDDDDFVVQACFDALGEMRAAETGPR